MNNSKRLLSCSVLCLLVALLCTSCGGNPSERKKEHYREACAPIIAWIEGQHASTGQYPETLPSEYQEILEGFSPPSEYRSLKNGTSFELHIGDYSMKYTFVYYYMPHTGWGIDN